MNTETICRLERALSARGIEAKLNPVMGPSNGWYMVQATVKIGDDIKIASTKWSETVADKDFCFGIELSLQTQQYKVA